MSKGVGKIKFDFNKTVRIKIRSGDLNIKQSEDNFIYFKTEDSYFYMKSTEDDKNIFVDVGRLNPKNGKIQGFNDLDIEIPDNVKIEVELLKGDIEAYDLNLKEFKISTKLGDIDLSNINCERLTIDSVNGDIDVNAEVEDFYSRAVRGDMEIQLHEQLLTAKIESIKGDLLLNLSEEPKVIKVSSIQGDCFINGEPIIFADGNGKADIKIKSVKGDVNVLYFNKIINEESKEDSREIKKVLEMLKNKKITKEEAEKLLASLNKEVI